MKKRLSFFLFFFGTIYTLFAQWEIPAIREESLLIIHQGFTLDYSEANEQALWVAYKLKPSMLSGSFKRRNFFYFDPYVPTGSSTSADYKNSGYDRGHLAPAADMKESFTMFKESFYMSNIAPQLPAFNRGIWKELETWVRKQVMKYGTLYIVTGPVFSFPHPNCNLLDKKELDCLFASLSIDQKTARELAFESDSFLEKHPPIGKNQVTVPFGFYKALLKVEELTMLIAFFIPQEKPNSSDLFDFTLSVDQLEAITNIDFFPLLPDSTEEELESENHFAIWKEAGN